MAPEAAVEPGVREFHASQPTRVVVGSGIAERVGSYATSYGERALLVTGESHARTSGLLARVQASLHAEGVASELLQPAANAMRIALHPRGMAPRILNLPEWSGHLLHVLARRAEAEGDPDLRALHDELAALPGIDPMPPSPAAGVVVPLRLRAGDGGELTFLSTTSRFGTALDVTLAGLWIEAFYPADDATAEALRVTA